MYSIISSFYSVEPIVPAVHAFGADRIILLIDKKTMEENREAKESLSMLRKIFGNVAEIEVKMLKGNEIYELTKEIVPIIEKEKKLGKDRKIVINVSGGARIQAYSLLYAAYARNKLINSIVCTETEERGKIIELPILDYGLTPAKREILEEIGKGKQTIVQIAKNIGKTRALVYQHLRELKERGYVNEHFEITTAGRIALL